MQKNGCIICFEQMMLFLSYGKLRFSYDKTLREDAHSRAEKMSAKLTTLGAQKQSGLS